MTGAGAGVGATRIRFAGISLGGSSEKYINTGPAAVDRSRAVDP